MVLPRSGPTAPLGVTLAQRSLANGSLLKLEDWPELNGLSLSDTLASFVRSVARGQGRGVGRRRPSRPAEDRPRGGDFCQFDPARFNADERTYFRLTRWRQTRAAAQLLANLGAEFTADAQIFNKVPRGIIPSSLFGH
jgi:beta-galactosidase